MSLHSITQIGIRAAAIFKGKINQKQLIQDLNIKKEDNKIKEPKLTI
jgi:hypothetical protein